jgi:hypothetical protein
MSRGNQIGQINIRSSGFNRDNVAQTQPQRIQAFMPHGNSAEQVNGRFGGFNRGNVAQTQPQQIQTFRPNQNVRPTFSAPTAIPPVRQENRIGNQFQSFNSPRPGFDDINGGPPNDRNTINLLRSRRNDGDRDDFRFRHFNDHDRDDFRFPRRNDFDADDFRFGRFNDHDADDFFRTRRRAFIEPAPFYPYQRYPNLFSNFNFSFDYFPQRPFYPNQVPFYPNYVEQIPQYGYEDYGAQFFRECVFRDGNFYHNNELVNIYILNGRYCFNFNGQPYYLPYNCGIYHDGYRHIYSGYPINVYDFNVAYNGRNFAVGGRFHWFR